MFSSVIGLFVPPALLPHYPAHFLPNLYSLGASVHPGFLPSRLSSTHPARMQGKDARKENEDGRIKGNLICTVEYS